MLRPHPAVIGYCGINGAGNAGDTLGTDDDPGVAAAESFICGTCVMGEGAGAYVGAGTAALCGIVRLLCTAANTYDVQCLFPTVITAEPTSTVYPGIALWLSYPAAPTSMLMSHN